MVTGFPLLKLGKGDVALVQKETQETDYDEVPQYSGQTVADVQLHYQLKSQTWSAVESLARAVTLYRFAWR